MPFSTSSQEREGVCTDTSFGAIVLAGTYGWGGVAVSQLPPRPLAEVVFEPIIFSPLRWLQSAGADRVVVCANGSSRVLRERLGTAPLRLHVDFEEDHHPRGPAGCIHDAGIRADGDPLVVVEATVIPTIDLGDLLRAHEDSRAALTVVTSRTEDGGGSAPTGIYVLDREVLEHIPETGFQDLKEAIIPRLHRAGKRVVTYTSAQHCPRVGDVESYLSVNLWMVEQISAGLWPLHELETWIRLGEVVAHPSAAVDAGALLIGPAIVGPRALIASGATIVGPAVVGEDALIEPHALVSRSLVGAGSVIGSGAIFHQSVAARSSFIEAGARLHDAVPGRARWGASWRHRLRTGRRRQDRDGRFLPQPVSLLPTRAAAKRPDAIPAKEVVGA